ncbi:MAG: ABC transporter substrate-binding protein [Bryobacteraceae bacterium]
MLSRTARLLPRLSIGIVLTAVAFGQWGGELKFVLRADPKTFDPLVVADEPSEWVRYLTAGVLLRIDRKTQEPTPELATSWKIAPDGKRIEFALRKGVRFSDGSPFDAQDVVYTFTRLNDARLHSPIADAFRVGTVPAKAVALGSHRVAISFGAPLAGMERHFDSLAILSSRSRLREKAVLGPFVLAAYQAGSAVELKRNPNYWKTDASGRRLPYLDSVRMEIQQNRDIELLRFRRGELHFISALDGEAFDRLRKEKPEAARDVGVSLESEMIWFNQTSQAALDPSKRAWFRSKEFRRAMSLAINRADLVRLAYKGYAKPAAGPVSAANRVWSNPAVAAQRQQIETAAKLLAGAGFKLDGGVLRGSEGKAVEFSLITNAGSKIRARMAALVQQDLARVGVKMNIVALDFPSLIERITRSFDYEACLLGLVNVDPDPNGQMNIWLSSASNHQWNPNQAKPETAWEAEIDKLMIAQSSTAAHAKRKALFDRVQEIAAEQSPFLYLVNPNALVAISPTLRNVQPTALGPRVFWNVEHLQLAGGMQASR